MKWKTIRADVESIYPGCRFIGGTDELEISAALLGGGTALVPRAVYACFGPVPAGAPGTGPSEVCLCLSRFAPEAENCILAPDEETLSGVFNYIQTCLSRSQAITALEQKALHEELDVQAAADLATEIMENPLLVADTSFRILGMSDLELDDSAWKHFRQRRQIPFHPDTARGHEEFLREIRRGRLVSVVDGKHKKGFFIRCAVMFGELFLAQIHVFSMLREFSAADVELTQQLAGVMSIAILRSEPEQRGVRTTSDYLISDLILGKLTDRRIIQARLDFVNWPLKRYKYLLLTRWEGEDKSINFRDACIANLCRIFPDGRSMVDGDCVVILFSMDSELNANSPELEHVRAQLGRAGQSGVLSFPFEDLMDTAYRYRQTKDILALCSSEKNAERFLLAEACSVELMISQAGVNYRLIDFCHPLVRRLMAYDDRPTGGYLSTLRAYIETGRSYTKTAERLHMHRNSVIYRMKQIEELLDYDFSREEFTFPLELSFHILDHMERHRNDGPGTPENE